MSLAFALGEIALATLVVAYLVFWLSAVADVARSDLGGSTKAIWFLVLVVLPVIGPVAWTWQSLRTAPDGWRGR